MQPGRIFFGFRPAKYGAKMPRGLMRTMKTGPAIPDDQADARRWRLSGLARRPSDGRIPSAWRGDEIGKHSGLKIRRLTACRFKSGPRYQRQIDRASLHEGDVFRRAPINALITVYSYRTYQRRWALSGISFGLAERKREERRLGASPRFIDAESASHPVFA